MSKDGHQQSPLKFISAFSSQHTQREFVDRSTYRSRPHTWTPRRETQSISPSPATKRK